MKLLTLFQPKFILIILVIVFAVIYNFIANNSIVFIIASVIIISIYAYYTWKEKMESFIETPTYVPERPEMDIDPDTEKIKDPQMKTKIFNDTAQYMWERSNTVKDLDPRAPDNDPPDTNAFAEWCYGLKPKTIVDNPSGNLSVQIQDTCKSGSIYMNQPEKSVLDRYTCKGSW